MISSTQIQEPETTLYTGDRLESDVVIFDYLKNRQKKNLSDFIIKNIPEHTCKGKNYFKKRNKQQLLSIIENYIFNNPDKPFLFGGGYAPVERKDVFNYFTHDKHFDLYEINEMINSFNLKELLPMYKHLYYVFHENSSVLDKERFNLSKKHIKSDTKILFHGTTTKWDICRFCEHAHTKNGNVFGKGLYATCDFKKAIEYSEKKFIYVIEIVDVKILLGNSRILPINYDRMSHLVDCDVNPTIWCLHNPELYRIIGYYEINNQSKSIKFTNKINIPFRLKVFWLKENCNKDYFEKNILTNFKTNVDYWKDMGYFENGIFNIASREGHIFLIGYYFNPIFLNEDFESGNVFDQFNIIQITQISSHDRQFYDVNGVSSRLEFSN